MMHRMKIPLVNIRNKIMAEGQYKKEDIDVSEQSKPYFNLYLFASYSPLLKKSKKRTTVSSRTSDFMYFSL